MLLARELQILKKCSEFENNQFVVHLYDAFSNPEAENDPSQLRTIYLAMEFLPLDMSTLLNCRDSKLTENQAKTLIYNLLMSVSFLH